jgi:hypothetical protein
MPSSTRLDKETQGILGKAAELLGTTKSQVVRESVREYCTKVINKKKKTPWQIYQSVFTGEGSGHGKRVEMGKKILKHKFEKDRKKWSS